MKSFYYFLLFLSAIFPCCFSNSTFWEENFNDFCSKIIRSHLHLETSNITKILSGKVEEEDALQAVRDFETFCDQMKNIPDPWELLQNHPLTAYFGISDLRSIVERILPEIIIRGSQLHQQCIMDVVGFAQKLLNGPLDWPMKMLDASGKPLSGILRGATHWPGDFYQCTSINMPFNPGNITQENPLIKGQYCTIHVAVPEKMKKIFVPPQMNLAFKSVVDSLEVKWDFCMTQHCKAHDYKYTLEPIFDIINETFEIEVTDITCKEPHHPLKDNLTIGTLAVVGVILIFLLIGTLYDIIFCPMISDEFEDTPVMLSHEGDIDMRYDSGYYNSCYEMESVSYDSSVASLKRKAKEGVNTANKLNKFTPSLPTEHYTPDPTKDTMNGAVSEITAPEENSSPKAPAPPPPGSSTLPDIYSSVSDINVNQNAITVENNGHIPTTADVAEDRNIFKDTSSSRSGGGFRTFVLAFSLRRNVYRLLNSEHPIEVLSCLNGIRFLSMAWIILAQTFKIGSEDYIKNRIDGIEVHQSFLFQAVISAPFALDTFFLLSGLLLTYFFLENYYSKGNVGVKTALLIYVRRYIRLTPCYAVILMVYTFVLPNLFDSPYWTNDFSDVCRSRWWANLLYVNNIFKLEHGCMPWTWYLANDMQFFLISPIILCQFILLPSFAFLTIIMMFSAYIIASVILWQRLIDPNIHSLIDDDMYTKPWCRISPFLIGIVLGYFLQQKNRKRSFSKLFRLCGWVLASAICLFLCYIKYTMNRKENPITWLKSQYTAYEVVSHPLWAMAISWVIISCASGNGGIVSDILSWRFWIIPARLTYGAYLLHPIVIMLGLRLSLSPVYMTGPTTIYAFIGHLTLSYVLSFIVTLLFEAPFRMVEKAVSNRK